MKRPQIEICLILNQPQNQTSTFTVFKRKYTVIRLACRTILRLLMTVTTMIFIKQFKSVYPKNISLYRITFEISLSPHKISLTNKQVHFHLLVPFHVSLETDFVKIKKKNELND